MDPRRDAPPPTGKEDRRTGEELYTRLLRTAPESLDLLVEDLAGLTAELVDIRSETDRRTH